VSALRMKKAPIGRGISWLIGGEMKKFHLGTVG
jgi:hypothetical protein